MCGCVGVVLVLFVCVCGWVEVTAAAHQRHFRGVAVWCDDVGVDKISVAIKSLAIPHQLVEAGASLQFTRATFWGNHRAISSQ